MMNHDQHKEFFILLRASIGDPDVRGLLSAYCLSPSGNGPARLRHRPDNAR
jgi:hypothetical protein